MVEGTWECGMAYRFRDAGGMGVEFGVVGKRGRGVGNYVAAVRRLNGEMGWRKPEMQGWRSWQFV